MGVKLKLVVSPKLLILTRAAVNPLIAPLLTYPEPTLVMRSDVGEYQTATLPFIVQVTAPCVCGHTP